MPRVTVYQCGACRRPFAHLLEVIDHIVGAPDRPPPPCFDAGLFVYRDHEEGLPFPEPARCEACGRQEISGLAHRCGVITREHFRVRCETGDAPHFVLGERVSPALPPPITERDRTRAAYERARRSLANDIFSPSPIVLGSRVPSAAARLHYQCSICGALFARESEALHHTNDSRGCLHAEIRAYDPRALNSSGFARLERQERARLALDLEEVGGDPESLDPRHPLRVAFTAGMSREAMIRMFGLANLEGAGVPPSVVHARGDLVGADGAIVRAEDWNASPAEPPATWSNTLGTAPPLTLADLQRAMDQLGPAAGRAASTMRDFGNALIPGVATDPAPYTGDALVSFTHDVINFLTHGFTHDMILGIPREDIEDLSPAGVQTLAAAANLPDADRVALMQSLETWRSRVLALARQRRAALDQGTRVAPAPAAPLPDPVDQPAKRKIVL